MFQSCNLEASLDNLADSISTNHVQLATKNSHCMNLWNFYVFKLVLLWLVQFHATIKHGFEDRSFWFLHSFPRISGSFTCSASFSIPYMFYYPCCDVFTGYVISGSFTCLASFYIPYTLSFKFVEI